MTPLLTRPTKPTLGLSLQFASRDAVVAAHRGVLTRARVRRWLAAALDTPAEVTVRVVGTDEGRTLNRDYRGRDHATDVLTFGYDRTPVVMADLVLCAPVVEAQAAELGLTLEAHYAHLVVHGALHALGHDHESAPEADAMEAIERSVLQRLGYADPYVLAETANAPVRVTA